MYENSVYSGYTTGELGGGATEQHSHSFTDWSV